MKRSNITIIDNDYILGSNGVLVDVQGNLCGYICSDIVKHSGLEADKENLVDRIKPEVTKKVQNKIDIIAKEKDSNIAAAVVVGLAIGAAIAVGAQTAADLYYGVGQAEADAHNMETRVKAKKASKSD